jgi:peptidoglycan/LPS O-acetylase OafA/YrhL
MELQQLSSTLRSLDTAGRPYLRYVDERTSATRTRLFHLLRQSLRPAQLARYTARLSYALIPALGRRLLYDEPYYPPPTAPYSRRRHSSSSETENDTAWLTGLRGIAAVKVLTFHYVMAFSDCGFKPWGADERHMHFLQLPVIRYVYAGFTAHIFFGVSGYLITKKVLGAVDRRNTGRGGQPQDVFSVVSTGLFRKVFRLYLPVFAATLTTALYIYMGFYESYRPLLLDHEKLFPGEWYEPKPKQLALCAQLGVWAHEMFDLTNIVTENTVYPLHDQHLWAVLAEMRGTLHLYGVLVAVSQCRPLFRLLAMGVVSVMYFYWNHWEVWIFVLGAMVAQLDMVLTERGQGKGQGQDQSQDSHSGHDRRSESGFEPAPSLYLGRPMREFHQWKQYAVPTTRDWRFRRGVRYAGFLIAFYLLSYPIDGTREHAPGYVLLNKLIPRFMVRKDKFYPNIGTALLLLLLARADERTSRWRRLLTSGYAQYLGQISFALFLVQGLVMHSIGFMLPHKIAWTFGAELYVLSDTQWALGLSLGWLLTLVMALWAADVWHREVEGRCVALMGTIESLCFANQELTEDSRRAEPHHSRRDRSEE